MAEVVVGVEGCEERLFIGGIRRWRGGAAVLGRRGSRPALMAVGAGAVSRSDGVGGEEATGRRDSSGRRGEHPGRTGTRVGG